MSQTLEFKNYTSFTPYSVKLLPVGFRYPIGYLKHAKSMKYPVEFVWDFIDANEDAGKLSWKLRLYNKNNGWTVLSEVDPIPFARNGDFAAYFDGNDRSGDPRVIVTDLGNKDYGYSYTNFDTWLNIAKKQSGIGDPPYDKVTAVSSYPTSSDFSDGFYFCPNCFEANEPLHDYNEAIRCQSCQTIFNMK